MAEAYLTMRGIVKTFPGVRALAGVQLEIYRGEVHALLGENGAGKSTLMKVLSGVYQPEEGEIRIDGRAVRFADAKDAERAGIAIIYQEFNLIPQMTVAENIYLGREPRTKWGLVDFAKMRRDAAGELQALGVELDPRRRVGELRIGEQQLVEIAKALSLHAAIVIMDEPTSALSDTEVKKLFQVIDRLKKNDVAVIYITHKLEEIFAVAQKVTVLRDGKYIATRPVAQTGGKELVDMMVGRELAAMFPKQAQSAAEEALRVQNLTVRHPTQGHRHCLQDIHFTLNRGEILGIAGLMGSGRTELMTTLFGAAPGEVQSGTLYLAGKPVTIASPVQAIRHGLALVTEDRKRQGLFLLLSVMTNISIAGLARAVRRGILRKNLENALVQEYIRKLNIKAPNLAVTVETLSGGNQQKVILAKWLLTHPKILLLDDPTRGIDVGAKAEIYQLMHRFVREGMSIILVSSELPELLAMSDRILVLRQGRIVAGFERGEASEQSIMAAATGQAGEAISKK